MLTANPCQTTALPASPLPADSAGHTRKQPSTAVDHLGFAWSQLPRCASNALDNTGQVPVGLLPLIHRAPGKAEISQSARQLEKALQAGVVDPTELAEALSAPYPLYKTNTCTLARSVIDRLDTRFREISIATQEQLSGHNKVVNLFNIDDKDALAGHSTEEPGIILYMSQGMLADFAQLGRQPHPIRSLVRTACALYEPLFPHFGLGEVWNCMSFLMEEKSEEAKLILQASDEKIDGELADGFFFYGETPDELRNLAKAHLQAVQTEKPSWALDHDDSPEEPSVSLANKIIQRCNEQPDNFWVNHARKLAQAFVDRFPTDEELNRFHTLRTSALESEERDEMHLNWGILFVTGSSLELDYINSEYEARGNNGECPTLTLQWGDHPEHLTELLDNLAWASGVLTGLALAIQNHTA